jgi:putative ATP-binding cassette transporter
MRLATLLWKTSPPLFVLGTVLTLVIGAGSAGILALAHAAMTAPGHPASTLAFEFFLLGATVCISRVLSQLIFMHLSQVGMLNLLMVLTRKIMAAKMRDLEQIGNHRLLAALTDDVSTVTGGLGAVPFVLMSAAILLCCISYLVALSPLAALGVALFVAAAIGLFMFTFQFARRFLDQSRQNRDDLFENFRSLIMGIKELKLHRARRDCFLSEEITRNGELQRKNNVVATTVMSIAGNAGLFVFYSLLGLLIFAVPSLLHVGMGVIAGYVLVVIFMIVPIDSLVALSPIVGRATHTIGELEKLGIGLASSPDQHMNDSDLKARNTWSTMELRGVTHQYTDSTGDLTFASGPFDLLIRRGEVILFTGGNGSGKTTIAKLITGLYHPAAGEMYLDDLLITDATRDAYRGHFTAIFADFHIFPTLLGIPQEQINREATGYLHKLRLDNKVTLAGNRLSTLNLSQGQRKRLALLTAFLEDRDIYVFDEWAADQDPVFKRLFYHEVIPELKARGKTIFVITHDEQYWHIADRMLRFDNGSIIEEKAPSYASTHQ